MKRKGRYQRDMSRARGGGVVGGRAGQMGESGGEKEKRTQGDPQTK